MCIQPKPRSRNPNIYQRMENKEEEYIATPANEIEEMKNEPSERR